MTEDELMLMTVLDCRRVDLYADPKPLTAREKDCLAVMRRRRECGEPLQYILGSCEFMGLTLKVDPRVLIPRPETELLVEAAIQILQTFSAEDPCRILDIGTGSGNIAVSLAHVFENARVTAVDISEDALRIARENAKTHGVDRRIEFLRSDLFSALAPDRQFDMIVTNPPYIPQDQIRHLPRDVQQEPHLALHGGDDGLDFYRRIVQQASGFLKNGGSLLTEIGDGQRASVEQIMSQQTDFRIKSCIRDYRNTERIVIGEYIGHG